MDEIRSPALFENGGGEEVMGRSRNDEIAISLIDDEGDVTLPCYMCKGSDQGWRIDSTSLELSRQQCC